VASLRAVFAAVQTVHSEAVGPGAQLFVTRSARAVTIYRSGGLGLPPVQVVLAVTPCVGSLLRDFDVDCCCVAYKPSTGRVEATQRGLRALCFGANVVDTALDSHAYTRRLEKYGRRGWRVALPGYDELRLAPALAPGSHLTMVDDFLVSAAARQVTLLRVPASLSKDAAAPTCTRGRILQGPARLLVLGRSPIAAALPRPRLFFLIGDRVLLLHGGDATSGAAAQDDECEGSSKAPLAAALAILAQGAAADSHTCGAVGRRAAGATSAGGEQDGPLSFVYDYASCAVPLERCRCVWSAVACERLEHRTEPAAFEKRYGLPLHLRFEETLARRALGQDWWQALYRST
jgi:hypothetical protein